MRKEAIFTIIASFFLVGCGTLQTKFNARTYAAFKQADYTKDTIRFVDVYGLITLTDTSIVFPDTVYIVDFEGCSSYHCLFRNSNIFFELIEKEPSLVTYDNAVEILIERTRERNQMVTYIYGVPSPLPTRRTLIYYRLKPKYYNHESKQFEHRYQRNREYP